MFGFNLKKEVKALRDEVNALRHEIATQSDVILQETNTMKILLQVEKTQLELLKFITRKIENASQENENVEVVETEGIKKEVFKSHHDYKTYADYLRDGVTKADLSPQKLNEIFERLPETFTPKMGHRIGKTLHNMSYNGFQSWLKAGERNKIFTKVGKGLYKKVK